MNVFVQVIGVTARAGLAALFCGLAGAALHYALAAAPAGRGAAPWPMPALQVPWQAGPPAFTWTTAELACAEAYETCNRERLVAEAPAAPLSARPFALQLVEEIVSGDEAGAALMAAEVIRRDPRSRDARQVLAAAALRAGDIDAFLVLFLPLFDVDAAHGAAYADVLAALSEAPEIRAALARKLEAGAGWGGAYVSALTRRGGVSISELIALHVHVPQARAGLLQRLTSAGQWDMAYVAFAEFISAGPVDADGGAPDRGEALALTVPFNPQLRPGAGPAPFNWASASRHTQFLKEGGAYAFYEGRTPEALLGQSFPLSPGAYTLAAEHSGEVTETGGFFRWQIACADGGPALARFDVRALEAAPSRDAWDFELAPGTCSFLRLSLHGVPGGFPRPARIELRSVRLSGRSPQGAAP